MGKGQETNLQDPLWIEDELKDLSRKTELLSVNLWSARMLAYLVRRGLRKMLLPILNAQSTFNARLVWVVEAMFHQQEAMVQQRILTLDKTAERLERLYEEITASEAERNTIVLETLAGLSTKATEVDLPLKTDSELGAALYHKFVSDTTDAGEDKWQYYDQFIASDQRLLEIGPGSGQFLVHVQGRGIEGFGVDINSKAVEECKEKGLNVSCGDGLEILRYSPPGMFDVVCAFQLIEHLDSESWISLVSEAYKHLKPEGTLILETLNPESLLVHYRWFPMDWTHKGLVHPDSLKLVAEGVGFNNVEIHYLPGTNGPDLPPLGNGLLEDFAHFVRGRSIYCMVAHK